MAAKRGAAKRILGDAHGDKESINPSHGPQPPFGTFLTLMFFLISGEVALVFPRGEIQSELPARVF